LAPRTFLERGPNSSFPGLGLIRALETFFFLSNFGSPFAPHPFCAPSPCSKSFILPPRHAFFAPLSAPDFFHFFELENNSLSPKPWLGTPFVLTSPNTLARMPRQAGFRPPSAPNFFAALQFSFLQLGEDRTPLLKV